MIIIMRTIHGGAEHRMLFITIRITHTTHRIIIIRITHMATVVVIQLVEYIMAQEILVRRGAERQEVQLLIEVELPM